jgi:hypothetical protein
VRVSVGRLNLRRLTLFAVFNSYLQRPANPALYE